MGERGEALHSTVTDFGKVTVPTNTLQRCTMHLISQHHLNPYIDDWRDHVCGEYLEPIVVGMRHRIKCTKTCQIAGVAFVLGGRIVCWEFINAIVMEGDSVDMTFESSFKFDNALSPDAFTAAPRLLPQQQQTRREKVHRALLRGHKNVEPLVITGGYMAWLLGAAIIVGNIWKGLSHAAH